MFGGQVLRTRVAWYVSTYDVGCPVAITISTKVMTMGLLLISAANKITRVGRFPSRGELHLPIAIALAVVAQIWSTGYSPLTLFQGE